MADRVWVKVRRFFGLKTSEEVEVEVHDEPRVRRAQKALEKADRVMSELEKLERRHR